ncbi:HAD family hydrolase [Candidatus Micrarchaeota archaeon]|nr:HAD family hydrolase [Candidatus Micrarchaeota archaeon]
MASASAILPAQTILPLNVRPTEAHLRRAFFERIWEMSKGKKEGNGITSFQEINWQKIRGIIFDLDGTLEPYHNDRDELFTQMLLDNMDDSQKQAFSGLIEGESAYINSIKVGTIYERDSGTVLWVPQNWKERIASMQQLQLDELILMALSSLFTPIYEKQGKNPKCVSEKRKKIRLCAVLAGMSHEQIVKVTGDYHEKRLRGIQEELKKFQHFIEWAETMRKAGFKISVASNSSERISNAILDARGMRKHADCVIGDARKPFKAQKSYSKAANAMGLEPREIIVVGDSFTNDVQSAHHEGYVAVYLGSSKADDFNPFQLHMQAPTLEAFLGFMQGQIFACR